MEPCVIFGFNFGSNIYLQNLVNELFTKLLGQSLLNLTALLFVNINSQFPTDPGKELIFHSS